ncbi:MAG: hypothetical protein HMLKMBBP_02494 [Planctomycetes bacterium]|nr:hypothetical protein [Planctomycetota bacterium]
MSAQRGKSVVVTFRVDSHLAEALDRIPDKSAFIREALVNRLHEPCPACNGTGRVDCDAAEWLAGVLRENGATNCECCGTAFAPKKSARGAELVTCGHCGPDGHAH